jgi:hypothetical protein
VERSPTIISDWGTGNAVTHPFFIGLLVVLSPTDDGDVRLVQLTISESGFTSQSSHDSHSYRRAFNESGRGSTFVRAAIIADDVYAQAAPVPTVAPTPDRNRFLHEIVGPSDVEVFVLFNQVSESQDIDKEHELSIGDQIVSCCTRLARLRKSRL